MHPHGNILSVGLLLNWGEIGEEFQYVGADKMSALDSWEVDNPDASAAPLEGAADASNIMFNNYTKDEVGGKRDARNEDESDPADHAPSVPRAGRGAGTTQGASSAEITSRSPSRR